MTSSPLYQNTFMLRKPRVAIFVDIIKIVATFIKTIFKDSKKLKVFEVMYQKQFISAFLVIIKFANFK